MKKDNFREIDELRRLLCETKRLTFENYINPQEDSFEEDDIRNNDRQHNFNQYEENAQPLKNNGIGDIEKELIQIRKIALSVINRLADQTSSESYDTMKRVWALVDKAIESKNEDINNNKK